MAEAEAEAVENGEQDIRARGQADEDTDQSGGEDELHGSTFPDYRIGIQGGSTQLDGVMLALGIDIGGSGIKSAIVDTSDGSLKTERFRVKTPESPTPRKLLEVLQQSLEHFEWKDGPIGIGFPGVIYDNVIQTAVNLHPSFVGMNLASSLSELSGCHVRVINDADAAGVAEMRLGAGMPYRSHGTVLLITVGTGLGTVLFCNGMLVPNLELGHVIFNGGDAEASLSERARKQQGLSWAKWGKLFNAYLEHLQFLLQPNFIILGGGGVKKPERFVEHLILRTPWEFARFGNRAGIIGCALAAAED